MQIQRWKLDTYLVLNNFIIIGRKTKLAKSVVDKLIKSSKPIDDVPSCSEIYNVPNEPIVVNPLNNIAAGVLELKIKSKVFNS